MDRREFVGGVALSLLATPLAAGAQQAERAYRIGVLSTALGTASPTGQAFRARLKDLGYIEGRNLAIEVRSSEGRTERLPSLAADLVGLHVNVIVTVGPYALDAVKNATDTIPVVFAGVGANYPGLRDAPNLTGVAEEIIESTVRRLALLKEAVPSLTRVAILANPNNYGTQAYLQQCHAWAQAAGVILHVYEVRQPDDVPSAFARMTSDRVQGLLAFTDSVIFGQRDKIVQTALTHRLPGSYPYREWVMAGGLLSYGPNLTTILMGPVPIIIDKILRGAKPSDIPVEQPRSEVFINLKTAKALGLTIPPSLLLRPDEVIQ